MAAVALSCVPRPQAAFPPWRCSGSGPNLPKEDVIPSPSVGTGISMQVGRMQGGSRKRCSAWKLAHRFRSSCFCATVLSRSFSFASFADFSSARCFACGAAQNHHRHQQYRLVVRGPKTMGGETATVSWPDEPPLSFFWHSPLISCAVAPPRVPAARRPLPSGTLPPVPRQARRLRTPGRCACATLFKAPGLQGCTSARCLAAAASSSASSRFASAIISSSDAP